MKDRYRTLFCDAAFYTQYQDVFRQWKTLFAPLKPIEKVQAWVAGLCCLRRSHDWYGGKRLDIFLTNDNKKHPMTIGQIFANTPIKPNNNVEPDTNLLTFINQCKIKAVPESCFRALCFTINRRYPLIVTTDVPTPHELLKIQISGQRVISFNEDYGLWPTTLYSDRDFLGFILHDLIHADHFFFEPQHRDGQLGFFLYLQNFLFDPELNRLLTTNDDFKSGFEYIISDMNSHPVHLFQTLHALLLTTYKDDVKARALWQGWATQTPLNHQQLMAILKVNSSDFNDDHKATLESFCISLGRPAII